MSTNARFLLSLVCLSLVYPSCLQAVTFGTYDPRSLAMGGTGVSQANIDHAAYYNPALLSLAQDDDDFSLLIPTIGVRAYDPEQFLEALEDHQDGKYETVMQDSVTTFQNSGSPAEFQANASLVADSAQQLYDSLVALSDKELDLEVHAGVGLAIPGKSLGLAVIASGRAMTGVVVDITAEDRALVQEYIDAANDYAANGSFTGSYPDAVCGASFCDAVFSSTANIRGAVITEGGVSLSHEFESLGNLSIGITPKSVRISTYEYQGVTVENSTIDEDRGKLEYEDTNIDIGVAKRLGDSWKFGLVVRNAVEKEYKTVLGNTITLKPTARLGLSHHTNWTTIALDVDLTENERLGLTGEKTKYAALGLEFDLSLVQLRVGARHNMSAAEGREADILSAGVGVYFAGFHADLGVAKNDEELAGALQIGFQF